MQRDSQQIAYALVFKAVKSGQLTPPTVCELCGEDTVRHNRRELNIRFLWMPKHRIVGHHWRGYDHPLDVWWVCDRCNYWLGNRHDGSLTKEQAAEITKPQRPRNSVGQYCDEDD